MPIRIGLTGHREPITNWKGRIREIEHHHSQRLNEMMAAVSEECTAWDVALQVFSLKDRMQYSFALIEAVAHLEYLMRQGRITRAVRDGVQVYSPVHKSVISH